MISLKKAILLFTSFIAAAGMVLTFWTMPAFADENDWWNFRNSDTNNAVTDRPAPVSDKEAWEKWSVNLGGEWNAAPTPPVIVNGNLYVGSGQKIYELDRETGAVLRESEEMPAGVGYAMNTPLYADGKIFIALERARICAVNISDMSVAWTSDNTDLIKGQTVSPLSYVKKGDTGYVYTGTWTNTDGELICVSTDDANVEKVITEATADDGSTYTVVNRVKALTWKFDPQTDDSENLALYNNTAKGFYWAGAYVNENYLAIGTDNASALGEEVSDVPFYTLDPLTGEIIDACYGIKGPVRSTVVYHEGCLYFSTKQARIYKIPVSEDGILGEPSFVDLADEDLGIGAQMSTATPAVYGGKIYLGVSGQGGQFAADGGHAFCVVRDDAVLSQDSYLYNLTVPGYPQAGALLSNYNEDADFDGDGEADGRVYLYFTYNAKPGGIFFTYDTPDQTEPTVLSLEESKIFVPSKDKQEYCISPVIVDCDGTMYYKNDSGYLFAVEINPAALLSMSVADNSGTEIVLDSQFATKTAEYTGKVPDSAESAVFSLEFTEGASAVINGESYTDGMTLALEGDQTVFEIVVTKDGKNRTYTVTLNRAGSSPYLSELASANGNAAPNLSTADVREIIPTFDKTVTDYAFDWIEVDNKNVNDLMNIFLTPENEGATVKVWPGENCLTADNTKNIRSFLEDGSIKSYNPSSKLVYKYRYPVYPVDPDRDVKVSVEVTSEDGTNTETYNLTFNRRVYVTDMTLDSSSAEIMAGGDFELTAQIVPENATDKTVVWTSSDETIAAVKNVETEDGSVKSVITGVSEGTAVITAAAADNGVTAECTVTVLAHTHDTGWELVKTEAAEPTCTEPGNPEYWTCSVCGEKFSDAEGTMGLSEADAVIPARGHTLVKTEASAATCTEAGVAEHWYCTACRKYFADGNAETEITAEDTVIDPLGHDWDEGVELSAEGCDGAVLIKYTCKNDPEHIKIVAQGTAGHTWSTEKTVDIEATCMHEGQKSTHCEVCGAIDPDSIEVIPVTGHHAVKTEAAEPTCTETGNIEYYSCSYCGRVFADEACTQELNAADVIREAYGHELVKVEVREAGCEEAGNAEYYTCARCQRLFADGSGETEITQEEILIPAAGHSFGEWISGGMIHYRECSRCGSQEQAEHTYGTDGVCTECGKFVFDDVDTGSSYFKAVKWAYANGIVTGTSSTTFSPSASCTRAQFAVMLYRLAGKPAVSDMSCPFTDISELSSGVQRAIIWAYRAGIVTGTSDTTYSPKSSIRRAQIAVMLYRMAGKPDTSGMSCPFTDITRLNSGVQKAIIWAYNAKITTGSSTNKEKFAPKSTCKRYQLTIMLYKYSR